MADLTLTFNRPVDNPILHLAGLGGNAGDLEFSTEFNLLNSNVPVTLYKLSGSSALVVATVAGVQQINNGAAAPAASGNASGKGSILVAGEGVQVITFRLFVRGNGDTPDWAVTDTAPAGDVWSLGFSLLETDLEVVKTVNNPSPNLGEAVVFTITASNNGVSHNTNVVAQDVLPAGLSFVSANPSAEYDDSTGDWNIGTLERGASRTLEITATVLTDGDITNTATIDGTNSDPIASNNQDDVTLTPTAVVMGHVSLDVTNLTDFLEASGVGGLDAAGLLEFLAVWDPAAAEALSGAGREALLDALRDHLDPDGDGRVVVFRWETLEQRGTVGFYVERRIGDAWMRIHTGLLPALVAAPMGAQYRMADPGARPGEAYEYRLIELEARGTTREYGPFRPQAGAD